MAFKHFCESKNNLVVKYKLNEKNALSNSLIMTTTKFCQFIMIDINRIHKFPNLIMVELNHREFFSELTQYFKRKIEANHYNFGKLTSRYSFHLYIKL